MSVSNLLRKSDVAGGAAPRPAAAPRGIFGEMKIGATR